MINRCVYVVLEVSGVDLWLLFPNGTAPMGAAGRQPCNLVVLSYDCSCPRAYINNANTICFPKLAIMDIMEDENKLLQAIGVYGAKILVHKQFISMALHLTFSALLPIYTGAHAALRRPPSAAKPVRKKSLTIKDVMSGKDDDDDDDIVEPQIEGLTPKDAIWFPVMAGATLTILYLIITYLKDPSILSKVMTWYFCVAGLFSVAKLATDTLNLIQSFVFPRIWFSGQKAYIVNPNKREQKYTSYDAVAAAKQVNQLGQFAPTNIAENKHNPLPGFLSSIHFGHKVNTALWDARALLNETWIFRAYLHPIFAEKGRVRFNDGLGLFFGALSVFLYNVLDKPWYMTNVLGIATSYCSFQILSPTTFWTGTLVLTGLFFYDIGMVFYTPMMVTVAKGLDVPIKVVLPGGGMLGLGDIVVPGIMMAMALRFDLYLHYLCLAVPQKGAKQPKKNLVEYQDYPGSLRGELWWTKSSKPTRPNVLSNADFKKTYFHASILGYLVGISATMVVLKVLNHAQPALLYLVPTVVGSLWLTAAIKGEVGVMYRYTENGDDISDVGPTSVEETPDETRARQDKEKEATVARLLRLKREREQFVFLFSLSAPAKAGVRRRELATSDSGSSDSGSSESNSSASSLSSGLSWSG